MTDSRESGAIILFVALICTALIAFVSIAIDLYLYSTQMQRYESTAEQIALASVKEYFREVDAGTSFTTSITRARVAGQRIAQANLAGDVTMAFVKNKSAGQTDFRGAGGPGGSIQFGVWDFTAARAGTCERGACFTENAVGVNSARVEFKVPAASPLRATFGRAVGHTLPTFSVFATAAIVPRHVLFAVDLSRSVTRDNYRSTTETLTEPPDRIPAAEYAYDMSQASASDCTSGNFLSYHSLGMTEADAITYGSMFDKRGDAAPRQNDPRIHGKADYRCYPVPEMQSTQFAINIHPQQQPEPLATILSGIHSGVGIFAQRGIPGDMVGMLGFDDEILPARTFELAPVDRTHPAFRKIFRATDLSLPVEQRLEYFLFPRYWGGRTHVGYDAVSGRQIQVPMPAMTDLALGLESARQALRDNADFAGSENIVVLFTDGLHNCPRDYARIDASFPCRDADIYVQRALTELTLVRDAYREDGITLHTFLIGANSGPHIVLRKLGQDGGCMWPESARYDPFWNNRMVNYRGGSMQNPPYFMPNYMYLPTTALGGTWQPLVNPCQEGIDIREQLNEMCNAAEGGVGAIVLSEQYTDDRARLGCDIKGRSQAEQIREFMRNLVAGSPFILVE